MGKRYISLALLLAGIPLAALPPPADPLPFDIALWLPYQLYWLVSLTVGALACFRVAVAAQKTGNAHLWSVFLLMGSFFLVVLCAALTVQSRHGPIGDNLSRIATMSVLCLIPVFAPAVIDSRPELSLGIRLTPFFRWSGLAMFVQYLVSAAWFYAKEYDGGKALYFDGHRVLPAFIVFALVSMASLYIAFAFYVARKSLPRRERRSLRHISIVLAVFIVPMIAIDELRFLLPSLWALYPRDDNFVLPLFFACTSLSCLEYVACFSTESGSVAVTAQTEGDAPVAVDSPHATPAQAILSPRELEVAGLLLEGLTYQEIGERLFISLATVKTHVDRIYKKTGAGNKMELANLLR